MISWVGGGGGISQRHTAPAIRGPDTDRVVLQRLPPWLHYISRLPDSTKHIVGTVPPSNKVPPAAVLIDVASTAKQPEQQPAVLCWLVTLCPQCWTAHSVSRDKQITAKRVRLPSLVQYRLHVGCCHHACRPGMRSSKWPVMSQVTNCPRCRFQVTNYPMETAASSILLVTL